MVFSRFLAPNSHCRHIQPFLRRGYIVYVGAATLYHMYQAAVLTDGAVKEGVDTGIGLIQRGDEVVLHHRPGFGVQTMLPVQRFQLHTNRVHRSILAQFYPVVKPVASNLPSIRLVSPHFTQGIWAMWKVSKKE